MNGIMIKFIPFKQSCAEMGLSKKIEYPTFARTTTLNSDVIYMILKLLKKYQWNKFATIYEKSHIWRSIYDALKIEVEKSSTLEITLTENYLKTDSYTHTHESLAHIFLPFLDALPRKARSKLIFFIFFSKNVIMIIGTIFIYNIAFKRSKD